MHPLETYLPQSGGSRSFLCSGDQPYLFSPTLPERGDGIGSFYGKLFRFVRSNLWTVGRTGGRIVTDIAKNNSPDVSAEDISKHVSNSFTQSTLRLINKLRGRGLKRVRRETKRRGG